MDQKAKFILIVKAAKGVNIRNSPRPQSEGSSVIRAVPVGTPLDCLMLLDVNGVDYARLVPQNPLKQEWVRVAEADHSIEYVDVYPVEDSDDSNSGLVEALNGIRDALIKIAEAIVAKK